MQETLQVFLSATESYFKRIPSFLVARCLHCRLSCGSVNLRSSVCWAVHPWPEIAVLIHVPVSHTSQLPAATALTLKQPKKASWTKHYGLEVEVVVYTRDWRVLEGRNGGWFVFVWNRHTNWQRENPQRSLAQLLIHLSNRRGPARGQELFQASYKHDITESSKWPSMIKLEDGMNSWHDMMRRALHLCGPLPKWRDMPQNTWPVFLQTVKVIRAQRSLRRCDNQMQCGVLDGVLDLQSDIRRKLVKSEYTAEFSS